MNIYALYWPSDIPFSLKNHYWSTSSYDITAVLMYKSTPIHYSATWLALMSNSVKYASTLRLANHNRGHLYIEACTVQQQKPACLFLRVREKVENGCAKPNEDVLVRKTLTNVISGLQGEK